MRRIVLALAGALIAGFIWVCVYGGDWHGIFRAAAEANREADEAATAEAQHGAEEARRDPAADVTPGSGQSFRDTLANGQPCPMCPEMVVVPAGSFTMGSPSTEQGRYDVEGPQHSVHISRPFAVGKFHVTVDEFAAFVTETGYDAGSKCWTFDEGTWQEREGRSWRSPGFAQSGSHPVVCLNWNDAKAYVEWLSRKTEKPYRLLTEAEFEYAARAGTTTRYFFGDDEKDMCRYGNGADQTAKSSIPWGENLPFWLFFPCSDGYAYTSPVGSFAPNAFGLYDMHGNAWEWTEDCWHDNYHGAPTDGAAWTAGDCSRRVVRGGSWSNLPGALRAAIRFRGWDPSEPRGLIFGLRLGRTLTP
jgi:formylglycine-generating enzyme required for sulfatase activity